MSATKGKKHIIMLTERLSRDFYKHQYNKLPKKCSSDISVYSEMMHTKKNSVKRILLKHSYSFDFW